MNKFRVCGYKVWGVLLLTLFFISCDKKADSTPLVANGTYKVIEFNLPTDKEYQIKLNGILWEDTKGFADVNAKVDIELLSDGQVVFTGEEMAIPEDLVFSFYNVVGHGLQTLPKERRHLLSVTVTDPNEGVEIFVKGLESAPNGILIDNTGSYMLDQNDVSKGGISVEVSKDNNVIWSQSIEKEDKSSQFLLLWSSEQTLVMVTPPTQEQRDQIKNEYDTWLSFMYSSEDYPDHKSLILKIASEEHFIMSDDPLVPKPIALEEGYEPITYELKPDTPTKFQFVEIQGGIVLAPYVHIVELYDPNKPDEPLEVFASNRYIYQCNSFAYTRQGEGETKFRCYKFVPKGHPDFRRRYKGNHYALFQPDYSFK